MLFKKKETPIIPNRKATIDGVIELVECSNCHRKVKSTHFNCIKCGVKVCGFCSEHTTIPYSISIWCLDCYAWAQKNTNRLIKEKFEK